MKPASIKKYMLLYPQPPLSAITSDLLDEIIVGVDAILELVVLWQTQNLNHATHLQTQSTHTHRHIN